MGKDFSDAYLEDKGLRQPMHIMNGTRLHKTYEELQKKYPDHKLISVSFLYRLFWAAFRKELKLDTLPPPLIVDPTKKYPHGTSSDGYECWSAAFYNTSHALTTTREVDGIKLPEDLLITEYEIHIYSRAVRKDFDLYFDNRMSYWVASLYIIHIVAHELCHYADSLKRQLTLMDATDDERDELLHKWTHRINTETIEEGFNDEKENEARAIEVFRKYLVVDVHEDDLGTKLHGPLDDFIFKVKGRDLYHQSLLLIRFFELRHQIDFGKLDPDTLKKTQDECYDIQREIIACAQSKKLKYLITD